MLFSSPLPRVEIPEIPLTPYTLARCGDLAGKAAFIDGLSGQVMTYGELDDNVRRQAGGWVERGLVKGEVVALMAPNCPDFGVVFHSVALAGGVVTTINPTYTPGEVRRQLDDSGATRLVVAPMLLETAAAASAGTAVSELVVMGDTDGYPHLSSVSGVPLAEQVRVDLDDVVAMPYSSGTTGMSKGVMLTHRNLVSNAEQTLGVIQMDQDDSFLAVLPFFHIYGMQLLMNVALRVGGTIVTMPRFDFERFLALHQELKLTCAFLAPPMVLALAKHPIVANYDLSSLRFVNSGAAPLSAELAIECSKRLGCEVIQGYGMTEASPVTHVTPLGASKPGSVGITVPNTETMIVDPVGGSSLGPNEDGEVWVRGPQVMKGYLNNPEATKATIDSEGWLHTGDIGHFDQDGYLYIVDRLKELIKYKGFQVAPSELEALLLTHPQISDAAVIGVPDVEAGEIPVAFIVVKPGEVVDPSEVQAFVAGKVAHFKQIRRVAIVDAIPKSAAGKILRRVLRDSAAS
jgi:acyl-CoA synthetase (AMP-forming)/AMP-acid ligase II